MVGSQKILTVSYGTFSCTLEGSEDSFETMKAIAEYFRDLAAEDRYFGAEPPVPDAEMLTRIAEREVSRRVEARMEASGIVLRVGSALDAAAVASGSDANLVEESADQAAVAPVEPPADTVTDSVADSVAEAHPAPAMPPAMVAPSDPATARAGFEDPAPRDVAAEDVAEEPQPAVEAALPAHPDADSVAAKLQRIRAVVGKSALSATAAKATDEAALEEDEQLWSGLGEDPVEADAAVAEAQAPLHATDREEPAVHAPEVADAPAAESESDSGAVTETAADTEADTEAETVAEQAGPGRVQPRVIRIRRADFDAAVAAGTIALRPDAASAEAAPAAEDTVAEEPDTLASGTAASRAETPDTTQAETWAEASTLDPAPEQTDGAFDILDEQELNAAALAADLQDLARLDAAPTPEDAAEASLLSAEAEAELLRELAAVETAAEMLAEEAEEEAFESFDDELALDLPEDLDPAEMVAEDGSDDTPELSIADLLGKAGATAATPPAVESWDEAEAEGDDPALTAALSGQEPDWCDIEEALAETGDEAPAIEEHAEAATMDEAEDGLAEQPEVDPAPQEDAPRDGRSLLSDTDEDADLDRLMDQTDAELNTPEASRRRDAIAQLRAAVAATEAARRMGEVEKPSDAEGSAEAYRDDLREVVRPRRPTQPVDPDHRSERPRPAPLKLVASQRVDLPAAAPPTDGGVAEPVRPRRVRLEAEAEVADDAAVQTAPAAPGMEGSFMDFARSMGAASLSDMLEAAAAYTSYVEGSEDFSRPQILTKVREAKPEDFSREDGLRSFGTLLREGRIVRARPGRFVVNEDTRFNPARQAG